MTRFILRFLDLWQWLFTWLGVDYQQLRILLWAKLISDNRQDKVVIQRSSKKGRSNSMLFVVITYILMGSLTSVILLVIESVFVSMMLIFSMIMVMTAVALVSDFTSVLLDTTDNAILLPRPIDGRCAMVARITHIILYLLLISLSLSVATIILGAIKFGFLFVLTFLTGLVMSVLLVVFLSNIIYLLLLRGVHRERVRDSILYFQIFMAALAMGSYQILPRLIGIDQAKHFTIDIQWWTFLLPPAWMSALVESAVTRELTSDNMIMALLGLVTPLLAIFAVVRWLAPVFNRSISQLDQTGSGSAQSQLKETERSDRLTILARIIHRRPVGQESFKLIWRLSSRDRKFKIKTYPTFGYFILFALILTVYNDGRILEGFQSIPDSKSYILYLHVSSLLVAISLLQQRFSDQHEAAWVYYSLPIVRPGEILRSSLSAMVMKYGCLIFAPVAIVVLLIWGWEMWDDIALALLSMIMSASIVAHRFNKTLPFSLRYSAQNEMSKGAAAILIYIIPAAMGLIHYALSHFANGVILAVPVVMTIAFFTIRDLGQTSWQEFTTRS